MSIVAEHAAVIARLTDHFAARVGDLPAERMALLPAEIEAALRVAGTVSEAEIGATCSVVIDRLADRCGMRIPRLGLTTLPQLAEPLRDEGWARDAAVVLDLRHRLDACLTGQGRVLAPASLPGLILASAALRGGLWRPEALTALARRLGADEIGLRRAARWPDLPFLELELAIDRTREQTNLDRDHELLRWFPDVTSLRLLEAWEQAGPSRQSPGSGDAFLTLLAAVGAPAAARGLTPARFAGVAAVTLEAGSELRLPAALTAVTSGKIPAVGLPSGAWEALCRGPGALTSPLVASPSPPGATAVSPRRKVHLPMPRSDLQDRLEALLRTYGQGAGARGRPALARGLEELTAAATMDWPILEGLISWYRALLRAGDKPATVATYHSIAGRPLLRAFGADDPIKLGEDGVNGALHTALALSGYADLGHPWGRICHFAGHAHRVLGWPRPDVDHEDIKGGPRHVRAAAFGWEVLTPTLAAIHRAPGLDPALAEAYAVAVLLMACGGLRLDEAAGLRVADVLEDLVLFVHATSDRGLKTDAARRLVPLGLFLPSDHRKRVEAFVALRQRQAREGTEPLLGGGSLFVEHAFQPDVLRQLLRQTLGRMLDQPARPHDLRHGFTSLLHLLLYLGDAGAPLVEDLSGWDVERQRNIRQRLLGQVPHPGKAAAVLGGIVGHKPFTGTSIATYAHLSDLGLGELIRVAPERWPAEEAGRMLGLNARSLAPLSDEAGTVRLEDLRSRLIARMRIPQILRNPSVAGLLPVETRRDPEILSPTMLTRILELASAGKSAGEIADEVDRPVEEVERAMVIAGRWMAVLTQKNSPRLVDPIAPPGLLPPARFAHRDAAFLDRVLTVLAKIPALERRTWCRVVLTRADRHRPRLRFRDAGAVADWLALCPAALPPPAFRIVVQLDGARDADDALALWRATLGPNVVLRGRKIAARASRSATGRGLLEIVTGRGKQESRSFQMLRRAAFLAMVLDESSGTPEGQVPPRPPENAGSVARLLSRARQPERDV